MKKTKLVTTDHLERVVVFEAEHAKRILETSTEWKAAPHNAKVDEVYAYPGEEPTTEDTVQAVTEPTETVN